MKYLKVNTFRSPTLVAACLMAALGSALAGNTLKEAATVTELPAVSGINGKIEGRYGRLGETYTRGGAGSLSLPIGQRFGAQLDAMYSHSHGDDFYGLGGHFFARRPEQGLIGVVLGGLYSGTIETYVAAVEAEYYLDNVTFGFWAGYNHVDTDMAYLPFNPDVEDRNSYAIANIYAAIYPIDNLMVRLSYSNKLERNFGSLQLEYQTPISGLCLYVDGGIGEHNYRHLIGGVRYYFGGRKSLKDRHRQDDPPNILPPLEQSVMGALGNGHSRARTNGSIPSPGGGNS